MQFPQQNVLIVSFDPNINKSDFVVEELDFLT